MNGTRTHRVAGWLALGSTLVILLATLSPWLGIAPMRIPAAWCLRCGGAWIMDAVSNILLFGPLGVALALRGWRVSRIALSAFALSLCVETLQSYGIPASRSPSISDLVTNTMGGTLGALATTSWRALLFPEPARAWRLTLTGAIAAMGCVILTALALAPRYPRTSRADTLQRSHFTYAPGYGWYAGRLSDVMVNGRAIPHEGDGPVVLQAPQLPAAVSMSATLRGRDSAWYTRAMLFVHATTDTLPEFSLSQRGAHLELHIERRGNDWGLTMPYVRLPNAVRDRAVTDTHPLFIRGVVSTGHLQLEQTGAPTASHVTLALTPTIGWSMLQSVVGATHPLAPLIHGVWLFTLCAPLGWWCGRTRVPARAALLVGVLMTSALLGSARWVGLPPPNLADWMIMGTVLALSAFGSARLRLGVHTRDAQPIGYISS